MIMQRRIQGLGAPVWTVLPAATQVQLPHGADAVLPGGWRWRWPALNPG